MNCPKSRIDSLSLRYMQNDRLLIGQYVTIFGDVISHVNITAVKSEDGGEYECTAKSKAGSVTHSARLNVYGEWEGGR